MYLGDVRSRTKNNDVLSVVSFLALTYYVVRNIRLAVNKCLENKRTYRNSSDHTEVNFAKNAMYFHGISSSSRSPDLIAAATCARQVMEWLVSDPAESLQSQSPDVSWPIALPAPRLGS